MVLPSCPKCGKELAAGTEFCVFCGASTKPDFSAPNAPKSQKGRSIAIAMVLIIIVLTAVGFMVGRNMPPQATYYHSKPRLALSEVAYSSVSAMLYLRGD